MCPVLHLCYFQICYVLLIPVVLGAPSINVDLRASFAAPPFLLELLESAAAENASCYFPLLSSVASDRLVSYDSQTDAQLYKSFRTILWEDGHIVDPAALGSWDLAVATRANAPRIEAHFQFWRTAVNISRTDVSSEERPVDAVSVWCGGQIYKRGACKDGIDDDGSLPDHHSLQHLDFDRTSGTSPSFTVYIDITSPDFPELYKKWIRDHKQASFKVRYKPGRSTRREPLAVTGYGVELALKRTDYVVIDDRDAEDSASVERNLHDNGKAQVKLEEEEDITDVEPLSSSELRNLALNTASFITSSEDSFGTLLKISQDFPKYSAALAQNNASKAFVQEHHANREIFLRPGFNTLWLNGQQLSPREINVFSLLDATNRERTLINNIRSQGLSPLEAVRLVSHPTLASSQASDEPQRYDFTDHAEGGEVIIWLNDIEKDKRYKDWPATVDAFLQRLFPGQLPSVRKNAHTVIFPVNLSVQEDVSAVVNSLQNFVKRTVPVRFGIVPVVQSDLGAARAKILYHLIDAYRLAGMMDYLQECIEQDGIGPLSGKDYDKVVQKNKLRKDHQALSLEQVRNSEELEGRIIRAQQYLQRLGSNVPKPPIFTNGVAIRRDEDWMQALSQRLSLDLRTIQQAVFEELISEDTWIPSIFLNESLAHRDPLLIPENAKNITILDLGKIYNEHADAIHPTQALSPLEPPQDAGTTSLFVIADFNEERGLELVVNVAGFGINHPEVEVQLFHLPANFANENSSPLLMSNESKERVQESLKEAMPGLTESQKADLNRSLMRAFNSQSGSSYEFNNIKRLAMAMGSSPGKRVIMLNGRVVGPLEENRSLTPRDLEILYEYERKKRLSPATAAIHDLNLDQKLKSPQSVAKLSTILALTAMPNGNEGISDGPVGPRTNIYDHWDTMETVVERGEPENAALHFVAVLDPSSETAQQWIPILKVFSELKGVHTRVFLNPQERLQELPTKRFYRHVLSAVPQFSEDGALVPEHAHFTGIPKDALLTMTMDVPPSWLVAPKESIHDLDNIKLSSLSESTSIEASYELENILIEGHSRDVTLGNPPRGAQLILGTQIDPDFAGTIIMANLGYFQFKANPGIYNMKLKSGASSRIFSLDSAATAGFDASTEGSTTQISLSSFKGATVFPRLSRNPGMEFEDVLESTASSSSSNFLSRGAGLADNVLSMAGIQNQDYVAKFANFLGIADSNHTAAATTREHADINIFSVASGHLYERMLNIMMVSVMRHTQHTVKFWFIEQFLSPSFKLFLPTLAAAYGFDFEMVTYKWPHWLRAQQEKQRTIWGYKILFLDVLFPLDLDKVIFVDADQIVRTDMYDLVQHDLEGAPYGFTPMCDSRTEMEGFRFWKQGYWQNFLRGKPYHISALYVVDLKRFRQIAAGDRLRQQYHSLSADPGSLSNLDQDLPNHMQHNLPIHSLPQEWLWCETWCSDESLKDARTIDLCNNPQTKEPKLDRARRQVPEWTAYDDEIAELARQSKETQPDESVSLDPNEDLEKDIASEKDEL